MDDRRANGAANLLASFQHTLQRRQNHSARRRLSIAAPDAVDFSSNDFLSLASSSALRGAYEQELARQKHLPLGSGGSRLLDGNSHYAEDLEQQLAAFHNAPAALLFNSGFDANTGLFACVPQPDDIVLYDAYIHASVHEGIRLSRAAASMSFAHNSLEDLERVLRILMRQDAAFEHGRRNIFVAVETVYSMDGDVAPIVDMLNLLSSLLPHGNAHLIVDEAHSTGVYGPEGRGLVCALGVEHRVLARLHTFGKALSANGAVVLCAPIMRDYLINYARSLIYTTAMSLPSLVLIKSVYSLLLAGQTRDLQAHLWGLTTYLYSRLYAVLGPLLTVPLTPASGSPLLTLPSTDPKSPIFSLLTPHPRRLSAHCQAAGFIVRQIVPPTVPEGGQRVRVCLHAGNTKDQIDCLVEVIRGWILDTSVATGTGVTPVAHQAQALSKL